MAFQTPSNEPLPSSGTLDSIGFPELLVRAAREGKTGTLHVSDGKNDRAFLFQQGVIRASRSTVPTESFARLVVVRQKASRETVEKLGVPLLDDRLVVQALLKRNLAGAEDVEQVLKAQVVLRAAELFPATAGKFAWRPAEDIEPRATANPYLIFAEGFARKIPRDRLAAETQALVEERFRVATRPAFPLDRKVLPPGAAKLVQLIDGRTTCSDIVAKLVSTVAPEQKTVAEYRAWIYLIALAHGGFLEQVKPAAAATTVVGAQTVTDEQAEGTVMVFNGSGGGAVAYREVDDPVFTQAFERMSAQNYYEVLGVKQGANDREVKRAYFKLAKEYHPDKLYDHKERTVKKHSDKLFALISRAYEQLRSEEGRKEYDTKLDELAQGIDLEKDAENMLKSEVEFQKGTVFLRKKDFENAMVHFQAAVDLNPREAEHFIYLGWCRFQRCFPDDRFGWERAVKEIEEGLGIDPNAIQGLYYLANIWNLVGELEKSISFYQKVLKARPHHVDAQRELRLIEQRRSRQPDDGGKEKPALLKKILK